MGTWKKIGWAALGGAAGFGGWSLAESRAEIKRNAGVANGKKIVIVGAGFGGRAVAEELARLLPDADNGEITLIDEDNFLLFTPMLTEAAGGELDPRHVAVPVRGLSKRVRFVEGSVKNIDLAAKTVTLKLGKQDLDPGETQIRADELVIALGSVTNFHDVPGVKEHSLGLKRLGDAAGICDRVLGCVQRAATEQDDARRKALLTVVVAGGGYTGVEAMAAINSLIRDEAAEYQIDQRDIRTVLVNPGQRLLSETSVELANYAGSKLREYGVDIRMKTSIKGATADAVELDSGERIQTHTLIWAAGVKPSPVVEAMDCEKGKHGGLKVDSCCRVGGHAGVWALGDCAEVPNSESSGATYAPTAQNATREGTRVARNLVGSLRGLPPKPFVYKPIGQLALVGKHSGVARVWGCNISGFGAWAMWRAVYLAKMPGAAQKMRVAGDWTLDLLFGREPIPSESAATDSNEAVQAKAAHP